MIANCIFQERVVLELNHILRVIYRLRKYRNVNILRKITKIT